MTPSLALAAATAILLSEPETASRLGGAARRSFDERLTLDAVAPRMVAMLQSVAATRPQGLR